MNEQRKITGGDVVVMILTVIVLFGIVTIALGLEISYLEGRIEAMEKTPRTLDNKR